MTALNLFIPFFHMPAGKKDNARKCDFAPEKGGNRMMQCRHCGSTFPEDRMIYGYKPGTVSIAPIWWCAVLACDGACVGFDIHPVGAAA
jgi:hypothetical protein